MHLCQARAEGSIGTSLGWERFSDDLRKVLLCFRRSPPFLNCFTI